MKVLVVSESFTRDGVEYAKGQVIKLPELIDYLLQHHEQHLIASEHPDEPVLAAAASQPVVIHDPEPQPE